jgi:hypothetical protein
MPPERQLAHFSTNFLAVSDLCSPRLRRREHLSDHGVGETTDHSRTFILAAVNRKGPGRAGCEDFLYYFELREALSALSKASPPSCHHVDNRSRASTSSFDPRISAARTDSTETEYPVNSSLSNLITD